MTYEYKPSQLYRGYANNSDLTIEDLYEMILQIQIGSADLMDGAVTNGKIADFAVDHAKIAHGSIGEVHIQEAAINNAMIQDAAISRAKIQDAAINTAKIEDLAVVGAKIDHAAITNVHITDGAITRAKIQDAAIGSAQIDNAVIDTAHIADAAITTAKIEDASITTAKIDDLAVTGAKIAEATIDTAHIADAAIGTAQIEVGAITTALIADAAIKSTQIAEGSITDAHIVNLTANKIDAGTLSVERLVIRDPVTPENSLIYAINNIDGALQAVQGDTLNGEILTPRTITADRIVAESITGDEIKARSILANHLVANTITAESGVIAEAAITSAHIRDLDASKITTGTLKAIDIEGVTITGSEFVTDYILDGDLTYARTALDFEGLSFRRDSESDMEYSTYYRLTEFDRVGIHSHEERLGIGGYTFDVNAISAYMRYEGNGAYYHGQYHIGQAGSYYNHWGNNPAFSDVITQDIEIDSTILLGLNVTVGSRGTLTLATEFEDPLTIRNIHGQMEIGSLTGNYLNINTDIPNGFYFHNNIVLGSDSSVYGTLRHRSGYFDIYTFNASQHGSGYIRTYYSPTNSRRWFVSGRTSSGTSVGIDLYLQNNGEVTASAFNNASSERFKHDIVEADTAYLREIVRGLKVNNFRYNDKPNRVKIGIILEQLSADAGYYLVKGNGDSIDIYALVGMLLATVQELDNELQEVKQLIA